MNVESFERGMAWTLHHIWKRKVGVVIKWAWPLKDRNFQYIHCINDFIKSKITKKLLIQIFLINSNFFNSKIFSKNPSNTVTTDLVFTWNRQILDLYGSPALAEGYLLNEVPKVGTQYRYGPPVSTNPQVLPVDSETGTVGVLRHIRNYDLLKNQ